MSVITRDGAFDELTGNEVVLEAMHHEVHEGEAFHAEFRGDNIASGTSIDVLFTVPDGVQAHSVFSLSGSAEFEAFVYHTPTASGGTSVTAHNRFIGHANTADCTVKHTPTVTGTGTLLESQRIGSSQGNNRIGGDRNSVGEWLLSPGTYLLRVTSRAAANYLRIALDWYEH